MAVAAVLLLTLSKPELRSLIYVLVLLAFKTKIMECMSIFVKVSPPTSFQINTKVQNPKQTTKEKKKEKIVKR